MALSTMIFYGAVVTPENLDSYKALPRCLLAVGPTGNVEWIVEDVESSLLQEALAQKGHVDTDVVVLQRGEFIMPGFIDTHTVSLLLFHLSYTL